MTIILHPDQTTRQPVVWMCQNPECRPTLSFFEFESAYPICPKCGSDGYPTVQKRVLIHWLIGDKMGPIQGKHGRFKFACEPKREMLATLTNGEAASGDPGVCNCPGCLGVIAKGAAVQGEILTGKEA